MAFIGRMKLKTSKKKAQNDFHNVDEAHPGG
jgi:hypothetical protein